MPLCFALAGAFRAALFEYDFLLVLSRDTHIADITASPNTPTWRSKLSRGQLNFHHLIVYFPASRHEPLRVDISAFADAEMFSLTRQPQTVELLSARYSRRRRALRRTRYELPP